VPASKAEHRRFKFGMVTIDRRLRLSFPYAGGTMTILLRNLLVTLAVALAADVVGPALVGLLGSLSP
jgi:hypothetical protein